jgi:hypothetical protein
MFLKNVKHFLEMLLIVTYAEICPDLALIAYGMTI